MIETDPLWFKKAIIYELHIRAFFDSNGDGIGDINGLIEKLPYLEDLGVTCLWLLPLYPSPLRDDGYDIADYYNIHPDYGTLDDFERLVEEAHKRGIRIITELVVNHTSRPAPLVPGGAARPEVPEARLLRLERHRRPLQASRGSSSPTPSARTGPGTRSPSSTSGTASSRTSRTSTTTTRRCRRRCSGVMKFWLDMGVDGFRCDAVPYLFEREGTNCENLPETHAFLKRLRAKIDAEYPDKVLLAEANQWPADVRVYFGEGDEFHMGFHFPVMPRLFMAIRREERTPIVEILQQTPDIPDNCQWAIFLRNHDELTLEMVTDEDRDYMYKEYAKDPRMRINVGIRRRLAPLMDNGRRRIELLHSLLFTLPGTPVMYYGDEIGMGDNIYLGDRNGVRTPMQWTGDRNAGFSRADTARLYAPLIMDPVYGYQAINVEAQERTRSSLLNWVKELIAIRQRHPVFSRGKLHFHNPSNPRVLCFMRTHDDEHFMVLCNLSRFAQPAELDLRQFEGYVPVELVGETPFPTIGARPYQLSLGPYMFMWFKLEKPNTARKAGVA